MENNSNKEVLNLIENKKSGLIGILFSRVGVAFILILVQFLAVVIAYVLLERYFNYVKIVQLVLQGIMVIYLINTEMDSSAKLTWMFLMMFVPFPAMVLFLFYQKDIVRQGWKKRLKDLIKETRGKISQDPFTLIEDDVIDSGLDSLCRYLNRSGRFPVYSDTKVTFFPLGDDKFPAMLEQLKKAEKFIFMEYFIIDEGYMWGSILKVLSDKVKEGVDVRVMYDGMCEVNLLTADYPHRMAKLGIKCKPYTPITPFLTTQYNYRDHRKILVIDGQVAFNGGVNLADEYINQKERFGHWKDTAIMLEGKAVQSFTLMFLQMWNLDENNPQWEEFLAPAKPVPSNGFVMPYGDCPLFKEKVGESVYIDILYRAKSYVHIMTPYLILDNELEAALKFAAERGVDVKIILPGIPDKKAAYSLAKSHYSSLIRSGVEIYEYTPGFVHAKVFVSDDEKAVVGTINLDYRSLYHHFECATYLYKVDCISEIKADYKETLKKCKQVTPETIKEEKFSYKALGTLLKVIAPLM